MNSRKHCENQKLKSENQMNGKKYCTFYLKKIDKILTAKNKNRLLLNRSYETKTKVKV